MYLYLIRNTVNGKGYVGITSQKPHRRWREHFETLRKRSCPALQAAIRKYGREVFETHVLAQAETWEELQALEIAAIIEHNTSARNGHGYNISTGGDGAPGVKQSAEAIRKSAEKRRGSHHSDKTKALLSQRTREQLARDGHPNTGRKLSDATRAKIAAKAKGRLAWNKGKQMPPASDELRRKRSENAKGRVPHNKGKKATAETRAKLSAWHQDNPDPRERPIELNGKVYRSTRAASRESGLTHTQVKYRLKTGKARYLDEQEPQLSLFA